MPYVHFLRAAHQSNLAEIAAGRLAQRKSPSAGVRAIGARFVRDHTAMDAEVIRVAAQLRVTLPDLPTEQQQELACRYEAARPTEFDPLFVSTQLAGHHKALKRAQREATAGAEPPARQVAAAAVPVIESHHAALEAAGYGARAR
ncbi:DUF4142 domain-containing protein [Actinoplanes sp. URMC 104]|uniref:DUF4142 domain-containing protein n=1 Tax=Actinoplanes sp. URMC 104 TaxID=3423409 RepID=UPI003F19C142